MSANDIVTLNVSQVLAATPNNQLQRGVIVTQGGTTGAAGTIATLTGQATLTAILGVGTAATLLRAQYTTFLANNPLGLSVDVLELATGTTAAGVTALGVYVAANVKKYSGYLLPDGWNVEATLPAFLNLYTSNTSKLTFYFHALATDIATFTGIKSAYILAKSLTMPATESTVSSVFATVLNTAPSATNKVAPFCFRYLNGVTSYGVTDAQATTFKAGNLNYVDTGAEGGISNTLLKWGKTCDGKTLNYWYAVNWFQINAEQAISNAVINGSNNALSPLYYNQIGINTLQNVAQGAANQGISYGMIQMAVINATPYVAYTTANPTDYANQIYNGLSCTMTPQMGFQSITFNLAVTDFVQGA